MTKQVNLQTDDLGKKMGYPDEKMKSKASKYVCICGVIKTILNG